MLVVYDDQGVLAIARRALSAHGYRVLTAVNGVEGVACFARTADEKNPERLDAVAFNPLGDFSHLGGIESLLELGQHRIGGAGVSRDLVQDVVRDHGGEM